MKFSFWLLITLTFFTQSWDAQACKFCNRKAPEGVQASPVTPVTPRAQAAVIQNFQAAKPSFSNSFWDKQNDDAAAPEADSVEVVGDIYQN